MNRGTKEGKAIKIAFFAAVPTFPPSFAQRRHMHTFAELNEVSFAKKRIGFQYLIPHSVYFVEPNPELGVSS